MHYIKIFICSVLLCGICSAADARVFISYVDRSGSSNITMVFVHGLTSDARSAWTNQNTGNYWPYIARDDSELDGLNIAVLDYESFLRDGLSVEGITQKSRDSFRNNIPADQQLVFVGHSLGGLIIRELLLQDPQIAAKTLGIVTLATPMAGSKISDWARKIGINGPIVIQLEPSADSNYVTRLLRRWSLLQGQRIEEIPVYCSSEGKKTARFLGFRGAFVVDQASAFTACTHDHKDWSDHDHNSINKPSSAGDPLHAWLKNSVAELLE